MAHTGAMIAVKLRDEDASRLVVDGGEDIDELHLTLQYLGKADEISEDMREQILDAVVKLTENASTVNAEIFNVAMFNPNGDEPCVVAGVGDPSGSLTTLKGAVEEIFLGEPMGFTLPEQHTPWTPHVTLVYTDDADLSYFTDRVGAVVFDGIRVAFGDDVYDIPLDDEAEDEFAATETWPDAEFDENGDLVVPNVLLDLRAYAEAFRREGKVRLPGVGHNLRDYWIKGKGAAKIRWGTKGSMKRCIRQLRKYVINPGGLCATYHKVVTGEWPRGGLIPSSGDIETFAEESVDTTTATHAGLAVMAADTCRVLMLQRSIKDENDPAAGTWEFPGGMVEPGEKPLAGAVREWQEEIGQPLPPGEIVDVWVSQDGVYAGFIYVIPNEDDVILADGRIVVNPDDPDSDDSEQAVWWAVDDAKLNPALRIECSPEHDETPWRKLQNAENVIALKQRDAVDFSPMEPHSDARHSDVLYATDGSTEEAPSMMTTEASAVYAQLGEHASVIDIDEDTGECPPGFTEFPGGKCVNLSDPGAMSQDADAAGGFGPDAIDVLAPSPDAEDQCPPGHHRMPDGSCMPDEEMLDVTTDVELDDQVNAGEAAGTYPAWTGVLTVEGVESGDGRMFAAGSLTWDTPPLPLMWQKETSHGGPSTNTSVRVGSITRVWREDDPGGRADVKLIKGEGVIDTGNEDGAEAFRRMRDGFLESDSVDVDNIKDADVELRYAEATGDSEVDKAFAPMFDKPELTIFKRGRVRGTTLVEYPAFVEAKLTLTGDMMNAVVADGALVTLGAVPYHKTATTDGPWDGAANERRLPSPVPLNVARKMYAWIDMAQVTDGAVPKSACKLPHHVVSADGTPGAVNLTACSAAIAALNGARGGVNLPNADRRATYNHLARHLRDADREPPPLQAANVDLVAATKILKLTDVPPREWFDEPTDVEVHGALTVTDKGRVYGYVAPSGIRHRSWPNKVVTVPMGRVDYERFHGRETIVADGGRVATGVITMNCGHATTDYVLDVFQAQEHYDNACSIVASVRVGENKQGVWVAGALLPDVEPAQVQRMMQCQLSGDWRAHLDRPGWRELAAALLVPVPGFPMARSAPSVKMSEGQLIASSVPVEFTDSRVQALRARIARSSRLSDLKTRIATIS